jgi:hypothetical protein
MKTALDTAEMEHILEYLLVIQVDVKASREGMKSGKEEVKESNE